MNLIPPCSDPPAWLSAFNAAMNVVQAVLLAALAQRAVRKDRQEAREARNELK